MNLTVTTATSSDLQLPAADLRLTYTAHYNICLHKYTALGNKKSFSWLLLPPLLMPPQLLRRLWASPPTQYTTVITSMWEIHHTKAVIISKEIIEYLLLNTPRSEVRQSYSNYVIVTSSGLKNVQSNNKCKNKDKQLFVQMWRNRYNTIGSMKKYDTLPKKYSNSPTMDP